MEDIISKIIFIEQKAKGISDDAAAKLNNMNEDISKEIDEIAQKYKMQADAKIAQIRNQEAIEEQTPIKVKSESYEEEFAEHKRMWEQNAKQLEDAIYSKLISHR